MCIGAGTSGDRPASRGSRFRFRRSGSVTPPLFVLLLAACGGGGDGPASPPGEEPGTVPIAAPAELRACRTGTTESGARVELCLPASWNGRIIAWAHPYVNPGPERPPGTPLSLPDDEFGGISVDQAVRGLGAAQEGFYGYASTSYRRNGLVAAEAVEDLAQLIAWAEEELAGLAAEEGFSTLPLGTFLVGASEGGLTTALALEEDGVGSVDGGLALCGPIGDFRGQVDWFGDFRVLFDHFFPGVMPGSAVDIPEEAIDEARWTALQVEIREALETAPGTAGELVAVAGVPVDPAAPDGRVDAAVALLRYSLFATEDAEAVLGGNPFDNTDRIYAGSADDEALNASVDRFAADPAALAALEPYETTGRLRAPLVTLHTSGDPVVPARQQAAHAERVESAGASPLLEALPAVDGFDHCGFGLNDVLAAFSALVEAATGTAMVASADLFPTGGDRRDFLRRAARFGTAPEVVPR